MTWAWGALESILDVVCFHLAVYVLVAMHRGPALANLMGFWPLGKIYILRSEAILAGCCVAVDRGFAHVLLMCINFDLLLFFECLLSSFPSPRADFGLLLNSFGDALARLALIA